MWQRDVKVTKGRICELGDVCWLLYVADMESEKPLGFVVAG